MKHLICRTHNFSFGAMAIPKKCMKSQNGELGRCRISQWQEQGPEVQEALEAAERAMKEAQRKSTCGDDTPPF